MPQKGIFEIKIKSITAQVDIYNSSCDYLSNCDPYVQIYINGELVHETEHKDGYWKNQKFNRNLYRSGIINKDSKVQIKMYDDDGDNNKDDLLVQWDTDIDDLIGYRQKETGNSKNHISTFSEWRKVEI